MDRFSLSDSSTDTMNTRTTAWADTAWDPEEAGSTSSTAATPSP
jgi:hypothetical protein